MISPIEPLLTDEGRALLATWWDSPERASLSPFDQSAELRRLGADPALAAAVLTQCELRERAVSKFGGMAQRMLLTRDGVEQATRRVVAQRRAQRFVAAGASHVADLGCGIGGDATAFAQAGLRVTAVDIDRDAAECAWWNLAAITGLSSSEAPLAQPATNVQDCLSSFGLAAGDVPLFSVVQGDVMGVDVPGMLAGGVDAIFADPARRTGAQRGGERVLAPEQWSPPLPLVLSWLRYTSRVGVKVAPGIDYEAIPAEWSAEWTSVDGDLVEAALWSPTLAPEGPCRQATVIRGDEVRTLVEPGAPCVPARQAPVRPLGAVIAEPDSAVIRAGLVDRVAQDVGMGLLSPQIAYLTGDAVPVSPFVHCFEVVDVVALKPKAIVSALRGVSAHSLEVKKRGADIDPSALRQVVRRALVPKSADSQEFTVFATRVEGKHRAIVARRLPSVASASGLAPRGPWT